MPPNNAPRLHSRPGAQVPQFVGSQQLPHGSPSCWSVLVRKSVFGNKRYIYIFVRDIGILSNNWNHKEEFNKSLPHRLQLSLQLFPTVLEVSEQPPQNLSQYPKDDKREQVKTGHR